MSPVDPTGSTWPDGFDVSGTSANKIKKNYTYDSETDAHTYKLTVYGEPGGTLPISYDETKFKSGKYTAIYVDPETQEEHVDEVTFPAESITYRNGESYIELVTNDGETINIPISGPIYSNADLTFNGTKETGTMEHYADRYTDGNFTFNFTNRDKILEDSKQLKVLRGVTEYPNFAARSYTTIEDSNGTVDFGTDETVLITADFGNPDFETYAMAYATTVHKGIEKVALFNPVTPEGTENPAELKWLEETYYDKCPYDWTADTTVDQNKAYYTRTVIQLVTPTGTENPAELGWYEFDPDMAEYKVSEDTAVVADKKYFEVI